MTNFPDAVPEPMMPFKRSILCESETAPLHELIIGYPDNFHMDPAPVEIVNNTMARFYGTPNRPTQAALVKEFGDFNRILKEMDIVVHRPEPCNVPDQLMPRDIGFVVGDTFFLASMAHESRKKEWLGIKKLVDTFDKVIRVPKDVVVEGGDIVFDRNILYVGISQRTTSEGVDFLRQSLAGQNIRVIAVQLRGLTDGEDCLHLDCVFVPVGSNSVLIYPQGMIDVPEEMRQYNWIEVSREEQEALATNVLNISPEKVISRDTSVRVNGELVKRGIQVIPLSFNDAPKTGGSFRCCTLPLKKY